MKNPWQNSTHKWSLTVLLVILAAGAFLRFYGLENQSLSNDELSSWKRSSYSSLPEVIELGVRTDVHPPGYQVFLYFVIKMIGDSEAALRISSAIFGVMTLLVVYLLGLKFYSRREALLSASLTAVLWSPLFYSQDARPYSMLLFFTGAAFYFWIGLIGDYRAGRGVSGRAFVLYLITAIVSCYVHYFGLYLVALQGLFSFLLLAGNRRSLLRVLEIYLLIFLAYIPWLPSMWRQMSGGPSWIEQAGRNIFSSFFDFIVFLFNNSRWMGYAAVILCLVILVVEMIGRIRGPGTRNVLSFEVTALLLWLFVPFTAAYLVSRFSTPILSTRNLIISLPPAYLLFSRALTKLCRELKLGTFPLAVVPVLLLFHLVLSMDYYSKPYKAQFREAVGAVASLEGEYENSMIIGYTWDADYINYYLKKFGSQRRIEAVVVTEEDNPKVIEAIKKRAPDHVWFVRAGRRGKLDIQTIDYLFRTFKLMASDNFIRAEVALFGKKANP